MPKLGRTLPFPICALVVALALPGCAYPPADEPWSEAELKLIRSLWLGTLPPLPAEPGNAVADVPEAARFGQLLFFDQRLSANGQVACSTCHQPEKLFTDGLPVSVGIGPVERNAMGLVGVAYSPWLFWDGRKDTLWSQALAPLEDPREHASSRLAVAHVVASDPGYRRAYADVFGAQLELLDPARFPAEGRPVDGASEEELTRCLRPGVDGVILSDDDKRGTFLPVVWKSIPDAVTFIRHLKQKAGFGADYWSDTIKVERYTTESW